MAKLNGLVLSSIVAGALVSFAASSAHAAPATSTVHADLMSELAYSLWGADPAEGRNEWAGPTENCAITWSGTTSALTKGACFFTLALRQSDTTITTTRMFQWWGANNPSSPTYYDAVNVGAKFHKLTNANELTYGDVLVTKYLTSSNQQTGYILVVTSNDYFTTLEDGNERRLVGVVDSSTDPHGEQDSRYVAGPTADIEGVGVGLIFVDLNPNTGAIVGHSWSNQGKNLSSYYTLAQRPILAGRFDRNK